MTLAIILIHDEFPSLCSFLNSPTTSTLLGAKVLLSTPFSDIRNPIMQEPKFDTIQNNR
jgi:hypothetical protein